MPHQGKYRGCLWFYMLGLLVQEHHVKFEKYKMQDALIQEEEEGQRMDKNKAAAKAASEREKKQRKKVSHAVMITAAS